MGVAKLLPRAEVLVITTPAKAAQKVASRSVSMARKSFLRVAGVIENMSSFTCEHGTSYSLFGGDGGAELAAEAGVGMLALVHISSRYHVETVRSEAREAFPAAIAPRDFDLVEIPFPERGGPRLVENGARQSDGPGVGVAPSGAQPVES